MVNANSWKSKTEPLSHTVKKEKELPSLRRELGRHIRYEEKGEEHVFIERKKIK